MKAGSKIIHRITGAEFRFVKYIGSGTAVVEDEYKTKHVYPRDDIRGVCGKKVGQRQAVQVLDKVWVRILGEKYDLLAIVTQRGKHAVTGVEIIDQGTVYEGFPVWKVWRGCVLHAPVFRIVNRA